ncbi:MAG: hypothetical protein KatS3mg132_034 [Limisphaera sp.]|nr:MAG: hypothetical protein KatS3mg132_034 [Limisphaera sp.]
MKSAKVLLTAAIVGGFGMMATAQTLVYDNSSNDQLIRFNPGAAEVGDEIILAPGPERMISLFRFQYWGENFSGDEQIRVRFYANDAFYASHGTFIAPGTILYDSGPFSIVESARQTILLDYATMLAGNGGNPVIVPDSFTWTVQFLNVDANAGERAGLDVYSPPHRREQLPQLLGKRSPESRMVAQDQSVGHPHGFCGPGPGGGSGTQRSGLGPWRWVVVPPDARTTVCELI